jgi:hypothetical protein
MLYSIVISAKPGIPWMKKDGYFTFAWDFGFSGIREMPFSDSMGYFPYKEKIKNPKKQC